LFDWWQSIGNNMAMNFVWGGHVVLKRLVNRAGVFCKLAVNRLYRSIHPKSCFVWLFLAVFHMSSHLKFSPASALSGIIIFISILKISISIYSISVIEIALKVYAANTRAFCTILWCMPLLFMCQPGSFKSTYCAVTYVCL